MILLWIILAVAYGLVALGTWCAVRDDGCGGAAAVIIGMLWPVALLFRLGLKIGG